MFSPKNLKNSKHNNNTNNKTFKIRPNKATNRLVLFSLHPVT